LSPIEVEAYCWIERRKWRLSIDEQLEFLEWVFESPRHCTAVERAYIKHMLIDELIRLAT